MRSTGTTIGTEDYLWVTGTKPSDVYESTDVSSVVVDGTNYTVWTTDALSNVGMGFILRWRARASGSGVGRGAWRYPVSGWSVDVPPSSSGLPFYQSTYIEHWLGNCYSSFYPNYSSLDGFRSSLDSCTQSTGVGIVFYGAQVEVRYVLTNAILAGDPVINKKTSNIVTHFVRLEGRHASHPGTGEVLIGQIVNFEIPPTGTCTTPFVSEGTVRFGGMYPGNFPDTQWGEGAYKDFTLTFSNCPQTPVTYYVHANGSRWVGGVGQSVVGVNDSIPGDPSPISGNPRGYGIQLEHRNTGSSQHAGPIYIHPNEVANPLSLPDVGSNRQAYTRDWQGVGTGGHASPTGVTHTIPLRARLVRTGSSSQQTIQPGVFNTSVIVVIAYP